MDKPISIQGAACPLPLLHRQTIVLGHGSGGKMTRDLVRSVFFSQFDSEALHAEDDSGIVELPGSQPQARLAFTTDAHVVAPLFFPGGDIGRLAACGTVNDLAMVGATPLALTASFIIEEGLPVETLARVAASLRAAVSEAGVSLVAGDTKVVQRGKGDGLYISTSGIGLVPPEISISGSNARLDDAILVSGSLGDHGMAVLAARGELGLETDLASDVAPLNGLVSAMLSACPGIRVLRDPTRGGLATTLNEIALQSQVTITLDETALPVHPTVRSICEMLGFDPLYVANEGKLIAFVEPSAVDMLLDVMHNHPYGKEACLVGRVAQGEPGRVLLKTSLGSTRILDMLAGEMLPRIC